MLWPSAGPAIVFAPLPGSSRARPAGRRRSVSGTGRERIAAVHPRLLVLSTVVLGVIAVAAWVGPPQAANAVTNQPTSSLPAFAQLTWNGTAFSGDTSVVSIGGVDVSTDHVELFAVSWGTQVGSQISRGQQQLHVGPVVLTKPLDGTTPLFNQAMVQNAVIAGEIKIFDTSPDDGTTRHRFSLTIGGGRVIGIESLKPDPLEPASRAGGPVDMIEIVPHTITYTDHIDSTEFTMTQ